jgi:NDP-mannose synthase
MRAVILAGGKGTRLHPYTTVLPKPLMPVGDMPILELLVRQLREAGVNQVTLAVGHLASLISAYFGDGERFGVHIDYSMEQEPLGTAAPLRLVDAPRDTFLVMNGDLLTDLDPNALIATHRDVGAVVTVGTYTREIRIDLGVVEANDVGEIEAYIEKPVHRYLVSMGIYAMEPDALRYIPSSEHFDLPDLVTALLASGRRVAHHHHQGYWLDIGRPEDYERAQRDVDKLHGGSSS